MWLPRSWGHGYSSGRGREAGRTAAGRHNKNPDGVHAVRPSKTAAKRNGAPLVLRWNARTMHVDSSQQTA